MIRLQADLNDIAPEQLHGFFEGWPNPPSPDTFLRLLEGSYRVSLAVNEPSGEVVGFAQAIGDGVLSAFIPLLEVRAEFQGRGLGSALIRHLLAQLDHLYAVDLSCDEALAPFYELLGFQAGTGMSVRRYGRQSGAP